MAIRASLSLLALMLAATTASALEPEPIQVTPRVYYVQGRTGVASAAT